MMDLYLIAAVRAKELELRHEAELARCRRAQPVSRSRIVLAKWLMATAARLWPEGRRELIGEAR